MMLTPPHIYYKSLCQYQNPLQPLCPGHGMPVLASFTANHIMTRNSKESDCAKTGDNKKYYWYPKLAFHYYTPVTKIVVSTIRSAKLVFGCMMHQIDSARR